MPAVAVAPTSETRGRPMLSASAQAPLIRAAYAELTGANGEAVDSVRCRGTLPTGREVEFDAIPFASGGQRLAFRGEIIPRAKEGSRDHDERMEEDVAGRTAVVVKLGLATWRTRQRAPEERRRAARLDATRTVRRHEVAAAFIERWHALGVSKTVVVLDARLLVISSVPDFSHLDPLAFPRLKALYDSLALRYVLFKGAVATCEDFIPGRFMKFLNNDGTPNKSVQTNFAPAFAHWTWAVSRGTLMVSDIQGVRSARRYVLTDPSVHSVARASLGSMEGRVVPHPQQQQLHQRQPQHPHQRMAAAAAAAQTLQQPLGSDDLGVLGVRAFFDKHVCNALCADLGLRPYPPPLLAHAAAAAPHLHAAPRRRLARSRSRPRSRSRSRSRGVEGPQRPPAASGSLSEDDTSLTDDAPASAATAPPPPAPFPARSVTASSSPSPSPSVDGDGDGVTASVLDGFPPTRVNPADALACAKRRALADLAQLHAPSYLSARAGVSGRVRPASSDLPCAPSAGATTVTPHAASTQRRRRSLWFFSRRASLRDVMRQAATATDPAPDAFAPFHHHQQQQQLDHLHHHQGQEQNQDERHEQQQHHNYFQRRLRRRAPHEQQQRKRQQQQRQRQRDREPAMEQGKRPLWAPAAHFRKGLARTHRAQQHQNRQQQQQQQRGQQQRWQEEGGFLDDGFGYLYPQQSLQQRADVACAPRTR